MNIQMQTHSRTDDKSILPCMPQYIRIHSSKYANEHTYKFNLKAARVVARETERD
jgi:hypothetical protein